jgi:ABC-2 type transport system ATP-binding protein
MVIISEIWGVVSMSLISVKELTKEFERTKRKEGLLGAMKDLVNREYETKLAVNRISFDIGQGEIVGYIGPNGAGKSTTIKMMVGILVPTSGTVQIGGIVPHKKRKEHTKNIGVVFGQRTQLWWDIPISESFNLMKYMYRIPDNRFRENMDMFEDILGLREFKHTAVRQLSLGQRMRADLCAALLHDPNILFLDEPTIGLDVVVKEKIRDFIREVNKARNTTVILTTHDMDDIEKLCSRVIVIDKGSLMYDGTIQQLKQTYGSTEVMVVETEQASISFNELYRLGIDSAASDGNRSTIRYDKNIVNSSQILHLLMNKYKIVDFVVQTSEIEEVIRQMYTVPDPLLAMKGNG